MQRLGLNEVVNASGRMTRLGVNTLSDDVIEAMAAGGRHYIDIEQLHESVGHHVAGLLGAEDAMVTTGAAAGVSLMVAACVAGTDVRRIEALPYVNGVPSRVVIQSGHQVNFGAQINQMIRLGGGTPLPIGSVNSVHEDQLSAALEEDVAAFMFVQSHHAVQKGMLPLQRCIEICRDTRVPVLVDAAAEEDLNRYVASGADLVTFSGGKAIGGPTSGIVAGRRDLIRACRAQNRGIGRPMKVGKEQLLGLAVALENYVSRDHQAEATRCAGLVDRLLAGFSAIDGASTTRLTDEAGRGIERAGIVLDSARARDLAEHLVTGSPAIFPRTHLINTGIVAFDPRPLDDDSVEVIVERVRSYFISQES